jgi:hypothetical protein
MKFTTTGTEGPRNLLREKQRRSRLAAKELRVQFPQFSSLSLRFSFHDESAPPPAEQAIEMHPPARAYFVFPCPHPSCDGEFDLGANVADIAKHGRSGDAGNLRCNGERVRSRVGRSPCDLGIKYSISVGA